MQSFEYLKPIFIDTDSDETLLKEGAVRYLKNYRMSFGSKSNGENGSNQGVGTLNDGNEVVDSTLLLPAGINKNIGSYESIETSELFYFNWNSNGFHGVYSIDKEAKISKIFIGPELNFQNNPKYFIGEGRCTVKVAYEDTNGIRTVKEIHLLFTDSYNWQFWINVLASKLTRSFTTPAAYWKSSDRKEFVQYPVRPPMHCPSITPVPYVKEVDDKKQNLIQKRSIQFAYRYIYTDGRISAYSPYSNKYSSQASPCGVDQSGIPRCINIELNAGSALVERIELIFRDCGGDWSRYDVLNAFEIVDADIPYWQRQSKWGKFNYNPISNLISYQFCGDKECSLISQDDVRVFENDIPIKSQSLAPAGDAILMADNLDRYPNLLKEQIEKVSINLTNASADDECKIEYRTIRFAAAIHNIHKNWNQAIYKTDRGAFDCPENTFIFGGLAQYDPILQYNMKVDTHVYKNYHQNFPEGSNIEGFLGYAAGSKYKTRSKQYRYNNGGLLESWGGISCLSCGICDSCFRTTMTQFIRDNNGFYLQVFEMKVPKGIYTIRLASHLAADDSDYEKTSTYTVCTLPLTGYSGKMHLNPDEQNFKKEIVVDVCNGDWDFVDKDEIFIITDNTVPDDAIVNNGDTIIETYLNDSKGNPIELATTEQGTQKKNSTDTALLVNLFLSLGAITGSPWISAAAWDTVTGALYNNTTDHNGFTWIAFDRQVLDIFGTNKKSLAIKYKKSDCTDSFFTSVSEKKAKLYSLGTNVVDASIVKIQGKAINCDNNLPLGGVHVVLTRGQSAITKQDGTFEIFAHDDMAVSSPRKDKVIVLQANVACFSYSCDCNCAPSEDIEFPSCSLTERIINLQNTWSLKVSYGSRLGLKGGGNYGFGFQAFDKAGRSTFVQFLEYKEMPSFITNNGVFKPSIVGWSINGQMNLPDWVAYISFVRTANLSHDYYLQWQADSLEYLDENGVVTNSPSNAISYQLSIESLLKYNETFFEGTTTTYQWVEKDFIRFYSNHEGKLYTEYIDLLITKSKDGKYLIIPYDSRIKDLVGKCNFWIEIVRPKVCIDKEKFCEICGMIPVINGEPVFKFGTLNTWDTYYQNRKITSTNKLCENQTTLTHIFESASISDFWGKDCPSCGRINIRDDKAEQKWHPDQIAKSNDFVNDGRVNGLGTFSSLNKKSFKGQDWGGIVSLIPQQKIILVICENDWFAIDYNMNYTRVDANGFITATTLDNNMGEPYQKVGSNFGCTFEDISSIVSDNGITYWIDRKRKSFVLCNMQLAVDISQVASCKTYFLNKIKQVETDNASLSEADFTNKCWDIISGYDPKNNEILISFKKRNGLNKGFSSFANNEREYRYDVSETIVYSLELKKFTQLLGVVPEAYGAMRFANSGPKLVMFAAGYAYQTANGNFNTFFGIETEQVMDVVFNTDPSKIKISQAIGIESINPFFVDRITQGNKGQLSFNPDTYFVKKEDIFYAPVLADVTTYPDPNSPKVSMLIDGKMMRGQFVQVRFVNSRKYLSLYNEISGISMTTIASERSKNDNTTR